MQLTGQLRGREGDRINSEEPTPTDPDRPVIDEALVRSTALLARLEVSDDEVAGLVDHMEKILDLVDVLRSVEIPEDHQTDAAVPSICVSDARLDQPAMEHDPGGPRDQAAIGENAPDWRDGTFVTPRVVG